MNLISKIILTDNDTKLILENVNVTTEGAFVCNAVNDIDITQKVFYVIINGESGC